MSYIETYHILNKLWIDTKDIQKLLNCGKESARQIRNGVEDVIKNKGYQLPLGKNKKVSTKALIEYLGLDMNYIIEMANLEEKQNNSRIE